MNGFKHRIPKFPFWILKRLYSFDNADAYSGDIEEEYSEIQKCQGRAKAKRWIWFHAIAALPRWGQHLIIWRTAMFKNYFKIALRNFLRHKGYTFINIAGLAIGIACCIMILLWVQDELSYDRFHENSDRIYRIAGRITDSTGTTSTLLSPSWMSSSLTENYLEIKETIRIYRHTQKSVLGHKDVRVQERLLYADPTFFTVFTFPLMRGDEKTALR